MVTHPLLQARACLPPAYRMERLVLPKPALDHIRNEVTRDINARLGDNEAHIYEVNGKGQVIAWNFSDGRVMGATGPLKDYLEIMSHVLPGLKVGCMFGRISGIAGSGAGRMWLPPDGTVSEATMLVGGVRIPLIDLIRTFFDEPAWKPHGVMGSGIAVVTNDGNGEIDFGTKLCKISTEHVCHPEIIFPKFRNWPPPTSRILNFSANYHFNTTPSSEMLASMVIAQRKFGRPMVDLLVDTEAENGDASLELKAWIVSPELDVGLVKRDMAGLAGEIMRRFGKNKDVTKPPQEFMFEIARWMELFENRYRNKTVFEVPITDEAGRVIFTL